MKRPIKNNASFLGVKTSKRRQRESIIVYLFEQSFKKRKEYATPIYI